MFIIDCCVNLLVQIEMRTEYHRDKGAFLPSELCSCLTPDLVRIFKLNSRISE